MTQAQLDRCVARATGESLKMIRAWGFSIADSTIVTHDPEPKVRGQRAVCGKAQASDTSGRE
jgi:hypothetical protein